MAFALIGRIKAEEVPELQRLFEVEGQDHRIVLDLKEVKLVDRDAVRFLACCEANGTQLEKLPGIYPRVDCERRTPKVTGVSA